MNAHFDSIKQQWQQLQARFSALKRREQMLVTIAGITVALVLCDQLFWTPLTQSNRRQNTAIVDLQQQLDKMTAEHAVVSTKLAEDPDAELQRNLNAINERLAKQNERLALLTVDLIQPEAMAGVLRKVLEERKNLQLILLQNEPAIPAFQTRQVADNSDDAAHVAIYKHGLTLELKGRYFDIVDYLHALEQLQWHFYWETLDYKVEKYPEATAILKIYTLSNRESWIGA